MRVYEDKSGCLGFRIVTRACLCSMKCVYVLRCHCNSEEIHGSQHNEVYWNLSDSSWTIYQYHQNMWVKLIIFAINVVGARKKIESLSEI